MKLYFKTHLRSRGRTRPDYAIISSELRIFESSIDKSFEVGVYETPVILVADVSDGTVN